jgi:hypothetical protein
VQSSTATTQHQLLLLLLHIATAHGRLQAVAPLLCRRPCGRCSAGGSMLPFPSTRGQWMTCQEHMQLTAVHLSTGDKIQPRQVVLHGGPMPQRYIVHDKQHADRC